VSLKENAAKRVFVVNGMQEYLGVLHAADLQHQHEAPLTSLAQHPDQFLLPGQNIRQALERFTLWETEELPVLASAESRIVIGRLKDAYALRRYTQELESHNLAQFDIGAPVAKES